MSRCISFPQPRSQRIEMKNSSAMLHLCDHHNSSRWIDLLPLDQRENCVFFKHLIFKQCTWLMFLNWSFWCLAKNRVLIYLREAHQSNSSYKCEAFHFYMENVCLGPLFFPSPQWIICTLPGNTISLGSFSLNERFHLSVFSEKAVFIFIRGCFIHYEVPAVLGRPWRAVSPLHLLPAESKQLRTGAGPA